jgi:serine/threonine-protein kinase
MTRAPNPSTPDTGEDIIDLEPSIAILPEEPSPRTGEHSAHVALQVGTMPSQSSELAELLRSRLRAVALFVLLVNLVLGLWNLGTTENVPWAIPAIMATRVVLSLAVIGLMSSPLTLSLTQLRLVEYACFGAFTIMLILTQYLVGVEYIRRGDLVNFVASEKNGVIHLFGLMMSYGVLIPNEPKATARTVLLMALGPLLVLTVILERDVVESRIADQIASQILAGTNALYVLIGAALAIYSSYLLNRLRGELREARRFGQYQLHSKLGTGGMGEVWLAEHQLLKRPCALKLIKKDIDTNPIALARFELEVRSAARLSHPNVVEIFDYGHTDDGTFYYVMEYLPGMSLGDLVEQFGPLPPGRAIYLIRQACGALAEAHGLGLIHRDLKPANLFIALRGGQFDIAKVLDFGLVKATKDPNVPQLTIDRTVSGTPSYMSPEQATGTRDLDPRADIYALGGLLYFALTGRPPFEGDNPMEVMIAHVRDSVVPPSQHNPAIPADLEQVILRCLAKDPADRYTDVKTLSRALGACAAASGWDADMAEAWWFVQAEQALAQEAAATT